MQNLEKKDTILRIKKAKSEIKKELEDAVANDKKEQKQRYTTKKEDAAKIIQEFREIIRNKKSDIVSLAYYQGKMFQKFRSKEQFVKDMVLKFKVNKSTMVLKISLSRLIEDYPKIKGSLSLNYFFRKT